MEGGGRSEKKVIGVGWGEQVIGVGGEQVMGVCGGASHRGGGGEQVIGVGGEQVIGVGGGNKS